MITETLALKYRPKIWDEVVGQDATITRLKNIIKSGKIPQAFLFIGNSGTGKTTLSRMLASYLSCESEKKVKKFDASTHTDIIEVNAGADGKIDDIRELTNAARFKPQNSKYKIICADEIQSILAAARNALLKPLEEPPKHTIYILSSMEPDKLDKALIGRCTTFTLNSVDVKTLSKRLLVIGEKEKFKWLTKENSLLIAQYADGSVRQAVANLEAVAQSVTDGKAKNIDKILEDVLGSSDATYAKDILEALYKKKINKLNSALLNTDNILVALNKMSYLNLYVIDCLLCPENKKVAHWGENKEFYKDNKEYVSSKEINYLLHIQDAINKIKLNLGPFMANDRSTALVEFHKVLIWNK